MAEWTNPSHLKKRDKLGPGCSDGATFTGEHPQGGVKPNALLVERTRGKNFIPAKGGNRGDTTTRASKI